MDSYNEIDSNDSDLEDLKGIHGAVDQLKRFVLLKLISIPAQIIFKYEFAKNKVIKYMLSRMHQKR